MVKGSELGHFTRARDEVCWKWLSVPTARLQRGICIHCVLPAIQDVQDAFQAAAPGGVETALLSKHKQEHLASLYSLSLFVTSFSTRQAVFMLDSLPDPESSLMVSDWRFTLLPPTDTTCVM